MQIDQVPAAILAGGLATRLRPITAKIPKALVEVAGRPFIDHQLELLRDNGIRRVVLCLGYLGEMVRDHVGDGAAFGMQVGYSFDGDKLLGTGGALKRAAPQVSVTLASSMLTSTGLAGRLRQISASRRPETSAVPSALMSALTVAHAEVS